MNERLVLPTHRIITPVATILMVIALAATLALGFGLRAWTEDTGTGTSPGVTSTLTHPSAPQPLVRMGAPR